MPEYKDLELKAEIKTTFPDADIFGVKLVNGRPTKAVIEVTNNEEGPIEVAYVGGVLLSPHELPEGAPKSAAVLRNLTAAKFDVTIAPGDKHNVVFNFILDMNPQDIDLQLVALIADPEGRPFQVEVHRGPATVVEAPTNFLDPQV
jgi:hypothetical protein